MSNLASNPEEACVGLRRTLAAKKPIFGVWSTLPGSITADLLAAPGLDFIVTDLQHGAASEQDLPAITAAVAAKGLTPLARVRSPSFADIGRALDLGAHGVFIPNVLGIDHAREVVRACRYGPRGARSYGRLYGGASEPLCFVVLESAEALADLDAILALDGVDGLYVGPTDLALAIGGPEAIGQPIIDEAIADVISACIEAGKPVGVHTTDGARAQRYLAAGAQIVSVAVDAVALTDAITRNLRLVSSTDSSVE